MKILIALLWSLIIVGSIGWVCCVIRFIKTDFQAPYRAEVIYGVGIFSGAGAVIGFFNIED